MSWGFKGMKHNCRTLLSLPSLFLSLSDQILGDLSDMLRKQDSQELATISGVDRELMTDVNIW